MFSDLPIQSDPSAANPLRETFFVQEETSNTLSRPIDALSNLLFARPEAYQIGSPEPDAPKVIEGLASLIGRDLSIEDIGSVIGAPKGSTLYLWMGPNLDGKEVIELTARAALTVPSRYLQSTARQSTSRLPESEISVQLDFHMELPVKFEDCTGRTAELICFDINPPSARGLGIGARVFARMASGLALLGLKEISLWAEDDESNGYYTWPRLGFNLKIPEFLHPLMIHDGLSPSGCTNDLFKTEGGAAWWKVYGEQGNGVFDLRAESESWATLRAYMQMRNIILPPFG